MLAVELSSFQLHWAPSVRPEAGVVLNIAEDHLDWHGTFADYAAAKAGCCAAGWRSPGWTIRAAAELLADGPGAGPGRLPARRPGRRRARRTGRHAGRPGVHATSSEGLALAPVSSIPVPGPVGVLDALAAAALARSIGVPAEAIAAALASFRVGRHRAELVAVVDQVSYVDDSKATNPHAAEASLLAYPGVVWIAGGLLKGASVDETVEQVAHGWSGSVLIGRDRAMVAEALSRHAPDVPVVQVVAGEDVDMHATAESPVTM